MVRSLEAKKTADEKYILNTQRGPIGYIKNYNVLNFWTIKL